jgi:hypothetical protein
MALIHFKNKQSHNLKEDSEYEPTRKMLERNIYIKKGKTGYEISKEAYGEKLRRKSFGKMYERWTGLVATKHTHYIVTSNMMSHC